MSTDVSPCLRVPFFGSDHLIFPRGGEWEGVQGIWQLNPNFIPSNTTLKCLFCWKIISSILTLKEVWIVPSEKLKHKIENKISLVFYYLTNIVIKNVFVSKVPAAKAEGWKPKTATSKIHSIFNINNISLLKLSF